MKKGMRFPKWLVWTAAALAVAVPAVTVILLLPGQTNDAALPVMVEEAATVPATGDPVTILDAETETETETADTSAPALGEVTHVDDLAALEDLLRQERQPEDLVKNAAVPARVVEEPTGHMIENVAFISQVGVYPTGCESVSAVMACRFAGISITVDDFIRSYLPKAEFELVDGVLFGEHPNRCFLGDPYEETGFGCYAPCIATAIHKFLPAGYTLTNTTGKSLTELCETYVDKDIPVIVWATAYMNKSRPSISWQLPDGGVFQWTSPEHCLLLTGYDKTYYYFNDPLAGAVKYKRSLTDQCYAAMGKQSLVVFRDTSGDTVDPETPRDAGTTTPGTEPPAVTEPKDQPEIPETGGTPAVTEPTPPASSGSGGEEPPETETEEAESTEST